MRGELNFKVLEKQFRNQGAALKGYTSIMKLINKNDSDGLRNLLRDHKKKSIEENYEVSFRNNVDELLDYYSVLYVAIIAGYIPFNLNDKTKDEIECVLTNEFVLNYYSKYYKLNLPIELVTFVNNISNIRNYEIFDYNREKSNLFERLLLLHMTIKGNVNISHFLFLLDEGNFNYININNLMDSLYDKNVNINYDRVKRRSLNDLIQGFIEYLDFLNHYVELMKETEGKYPYLWTSMFHLHGYWFLKITRIMGDNILKGLKNLNSSLEEFKVENYTVETKEKFNDKVKNEYNEWMEKSKYKLFYTERNLLYLKESQLKLTILSSLFEDKTA